MAIDIEEKSQELKAFVSQFETVRFLGDITMLMQSINVNNPSITLKGLSSPQRQLYYLAGLNVTSKVPDGIDLKSHFSGEEFEHIKNLLIQIERGYDQFFHPQNPQKPEEDWSQRIIALPAFLAYYNLGHLNFEEQIIERVREYFAPFNSVINQKFGLDVFDLIDIYNYLDGCTNEFLDSIFNTNEKRKTWEEFGQEMDKKRLRPDEWHLHLPDHYRKLFSFIEDKGLIHRYSKTKLVQKFGEEKTDSFLKILSCERSESNFLYYTEKNTLYNKPIFKINSDEFQILEMKQVIHAIYNNLFDFCSRHPKIGEKFYAVRGDKLEDKIEQVFKDYFKGKAEIYRSYFTEDKHEQDILVLIEGLALIIEAKASKRDEPRREPKMAYPLIVSNFEETIQKGYDQAYRVKRKFLNKELLRIYKDQNLTKHTTDVRTNKYHSVYSIIVTLERFGQLQTDLNNLLELKDDDEFPWSICLDDLEIFLLQLQKMGKKKPHLIHFLNIRQQMHGNLITADELEVCGGFLSGVINFDLVNSDQVLALTPDLSGIFDKTYYTTGLGFKDEKHLERKTNAAYIHLPGF